MVNDDADDVGKKIKGGYQKAKGEFQQQTGNPVEGTVNKVKGEFNQRVADMPDTDEKDEE